jgi:hypothetical protein
LLKSGLFFIPNQVEVNAGVLCSKPKRRVQLAVNGIPINWQVYNMARKRKNNLSALSGGILAAFGYLAVVRPWVQNWGSQGFEKKMSLPGDEQIPAPKAIINRSIHIAAAPEKVWPWLVQIGYERAGWYSYDNLEAALGAGDFLEGHSSTRIIPELQALQVGDFIPAAPDPYLKFEVILLQKPEALVLHALLNPISGKNLRPGDIGSGPWLRQTWCFYLAETHDRNTHLIARSRVDYGPSLLMSPLDWFVVEPAHFIMEQKMLKGIKLRAEKYS